MNFEQPENLNDKVEKIQEKLEFLKDPRQVSSLSELNDPEDLNSISRCFQVIQRNVATAFKDIQDSLNEILKVRPELHQEIDALITNSWVGYMAQTDEQATELYKSGAIGTKGLENGKNKEAFDFIKKITEVMPVAIKDTETFLDSLK